MDAAVNKPLGFCPHCEYPIDAGRCPECGAEVSVGALDRYPASVAKRRIRRRSLIAVVILLLIGSGYFAYRKVNWVAIAPTTILLSIQGEFQGEVTQELLRRLALGELSAEQSQWLFDPFMRSPVISDFGPFSVSSNLNRFPVETGFEITFDERLSLPGTNWLLTLDDWKLSVDEVIVASSELRHANYQERGKFGYKTIRCPPLSAGKRTLTVDGTFLLRWVTDSGPSIAVHRNEVHITKEIECVGEISDYLNLVGTPEMAKQVRSRLTLGASQTREDGKIVLAFVVGELKVPVAASVLVRIGSGSDFVQVGDLGFPYWGVKLVYVDAVPGIEAAERLDVRLVPDFLEAFESRYMRCFKGVVEWSRIEIQSDVDLSQMHLSAGNFYPPSHIDLNPELPK